jgi:hypothetical protein
VSGNEIPDPAVKAIRAPGTTCDTDMDYLHMSVDSNQGGIIRDLLTMTLEVGFIATASAASVEARYVPQIP